jgi:HrpA-like RNA helicase
MYTDIVPRYFNAHLLLCLLKTLMLLRPELRIVIMSPTMHMELLRNFFNRAQVEMVSDREHPVEAVYLSQPNAAHPEQRVQSEEDTLVLKGMLLAQAAYSASNQ